MPSQTLVDVLRLFQRCWGWRFIITALGSYGAFTLATLYAGTFFGATFSANTQFIPLSRDYICPLWWMVILPGIISMLPYCYAQVDKGFAELRSISTEPHDDLLTDHGMRILLAEPWRYLLSAVASGVVVTAIALLNSNRLLTINDGSPITWWQTVPGSYIPAVVFILACSLVVFLSVNFLLHFWLTVARVRDLVSKCHSIPLWIAASPGPFDTICRPVFLLFFPCVIMESLVIHSRVFRLKLPITDATTCLTLFFVCLGVLVTFFLPIIASGLPKRLREQRRQLLVDNSKRLSQLLSLRAADTDQTSALAADVKALTDLRDSILRSYPVWPVGYAPKVLVIASILASIVIPVGRVIVEIVSFVLS
jgi:hypothetical protein